ncbi:hypothetical protein SynBIOSE41_02460 [Synechococcus sp. BIOS-E4-1]|uniref:hypothetical protein n=1 Tax=Synechococcus sp. BIOS-E4-1 TaxID=1400864 RepID=UPI0016471EB1|nr:hypothetical protein [Synechococcus sp. BIOS-E4-1]QNI54959.1 hypothetical protein SynBIOSE41_02460 [Synechococcus sp. BIOS-E4-1]
MTIELPLYQFSYNEGFGKNGSPKKPFNTRSYGEGWIHSVESLTGVMEHAQQMHGWSGAVFQDGKRDGKHWFASGLLVCEFDTVKYPDSDAIDWERTIASNPRIEDIEKIPFIAAAYLSQSCDPSKDVFVGRIIATISQPITDPYEFKAAAELFHQDVETATGCVITDRCGCDKVRWWGGLKSPEHLLFVRPELVSYETPELIERAQVEVVQKNPYQYQPRDNSEAVAEGSVSPATVWILRWIFRTILPPPDAEAYNSLVTPAKALARLVSPQLDQEFCDWMSLSEYRMEKVNNDPLDFLYKGESFDNASVGWFIRAVDKQVPDWRDLFEVEYGAYPGLDCFNPSKRQPGMVN